MLYCSDCVDGFDLLLVLEMEQKPQHRGEKNQKDSGGFVMTHEIVEQNIIQKYIMHVTT